MATPVKPSSKRVTVETGTDGKVSYGTSKKLSELPGKLLCKEGEKWIEWEPDTKEDTLQNVAEALGLSSVRQLEGKIQVRPTTDEEKLAQKQTQKVAEAKALVKEVESMRDKLYKESSTATAEAQATTLKELSDLFSKYQIDLKPPADLETKQLAAVRSQLDLLNTDVSEEVLGDSDNGPIDLNAHAHGLLMNLCIDGVNFEAASVRRVIVQEASTVRSWSYSSATRLEQASNAGYQKASSNSISFSASGGIPFFAAAVKTESTQSSGQEFHHDTSVSKDNKTAVSVTRAVYQMALFALEGCALSAEATELLVKIADAKADDTHVQAAMNFATRYPDLCWLGVPRGPFAMGGMFESKAEVTCESNTRQEALVFVSTRASSQGLAASASGISSGGVGSGGVAYSERTDEFGNSLEKGSEASCTYWVKKSQQVLGPYVQCYGTLYKRLVMAPSRWVLVPPVTNTPKPWMSLADVLDYTAKTATAEMRPKILEAKDVLTQKLWQVAAKAAEDFQQGRCSTEQVSVSRRWNLNRVGDEDSTVFQIEAAPGTKESSRVLHVHDPGHLQCGPEDSGMTDSLWEKCDKPEDSDYSTFRNVWRQDTFLGANDAGRPAAMLFWADKNEDTSKIPDQLGWKVEQLKNGSYCLLNKSVGMYLMQDHISGGLFFPTEQKQEQSSVDRVSAFRNNVVSHRQSDT
mmetsp:Transcript_5874/g.16576  ORF Transcript_5874/g.16576 Transcript_5874/m.16576 type:complete len:691 (-) Transcript_5874:176-2248(-)